MTRRQLFKGIGAGGTLLLSGCKESTVETGGPLPVIAPPDPGMPLQLWAYDDYFDLETFADFEKETGIRIQYNVFEEVSELDAKLRTQAGNVDVIVTDSFNLGKFLAMGVLRSLEHAQLPHLADLAPQYLSGEFDPGNRHSIPYMMGLTLVAYRKDKWTPASRSWNCLWDPRLTGRLLLTKEGVDPVIAALLAAERPVQSENPADYKVASEMLLSLVNNTGARCADIVAIRDALISGSAWAALIYNGDAAKAAQECADVDYFIPGEGAPMWMDSFVIARETVRAADCHRFIDFMCRAENALRNSNYSNYATPCRTAWAKLDAAIAGDPRLYPTPEMMPKLHFLLSTNDVRQQLLNDTWHPVKAALRRAEQAAVEDGK